MRKTLRSKLLIYTTKVTIPIESYMSNMEYFHKLWGNE